MTLSKRSRLWATRRAARRTTSGAQRWFVSRSTRRSPGQAGRQARARAARPRGARRRWSGRRPRRGRCPAASPASSRASSSCARSRSWASSTKSTAARSRQRDSRPASRCRVGRPAPRGRRGRWRRGWRAQPGTPRTPACVATSPGGGPRSGSSLRRVNASSSQRSAVRERGPPASSTRSAARSTMRPTSTPASARMARPRAWKVRTRTLPGATASSPSAASARAWSSSAARRLNVRAQIRPGSTPPATRQAMRATTVVVLPEPAGATQSDRPGGSRGRGPLVRRQAREPITDAHRELSVRGRADERRGPGRHARQDAARRFAATDARLTGR